MILPALRRQQVGRLVNWNRRTCLLAGSKCNDAADRVVRRDADGHAISWNYLDTKAAHAAAQLREDFVTGVALNAVETAAVHRDHCSLHIDQIVFAQTCSKSFPYAGNDCATEIVTRPIFALRPRLVPLTLDNSHP